MASALLVQDGAIIVEVDDLIVVDDEDEGQSACCCATVYELCSECLAAIQSIDLDVSGLTNGSVVGGSNTANCLMASLNNGYNLTRTTGNTFCIDLGTQGDQNDPGIEISNTVENSTSFKRSACYAYKICAILTCDGDEVAIQTQLWVQNIDFTVVPNTIGNGCGNGFTFPSPLLGTITGLWVDFCNGGLTLEEGPNSFSIPTGYGCTHAIVTTAQANF